MEREIQAERPTPDSPLLVGLLVDVSASMMASINNRAGKSVNRLESFRDSFDDLIRKAAELSRSGSDEKIAPLLKIFAYGFGFNNPLSFFLGSSGPDVRDLLSLSSESVSTISIDRLAKNWSNYRSRVEKLAKEMFGNTPMAEGFRIVENRIRQETSNFSYYGRPTLFILSDGLPTDGSSESIVKIAERMKQEGVLIVSCYVTEDNIIEKRKLYGSYLPDWSAGAKLMFDCSSILPDEPSFISYLDETNWNVEPKGRLFTQINQSEILSEFMNLILSPLEAERQTKDDSVDRKLRVFVSYSHQDAKYLEQNSLLGYLSGLEREGFEFWHDTTIQTGELWDERIRNEITQSEIALVLVSQSFLNSRYCMDVEIANFLEKRVKSGLTIYPVILSPCDWENHSWLSSTQFQPRNGRTIEEDYTDKGGQDRLFLTILKELRTIGNRIQSDR